MTHDVIMSCGREEWEHLSEGCGCESWVDCACWASIADHLLCEGCPTIE